MSSNWIRDKYRSRLFVFASIQQSFGDRKCFARGERDFTLLRTPLGFSLFCSVQRENRVLLERFQCRTVEILPAGSSAETSRCRLGMEISFDAKSSPPLSSWCRSSSLLDINDRVMCPTSCLSSLVLPVAPTGTRHRPGRNEKNRTESQLRKRACGCALISLMAESKETSGNSRMCRRHTRMAARRRQPRRGERRL